MIQIFDGVVRTTMDVKHIPNWRRSLISIGAFSRRALRCVLDDKRLKVIKGSLVMKGC